MDSVDRDAVLCSIMAVPRDVRGAPISRQTNANEVLARLRVPVLVTQGRRDQIVLPSMAEHILGICPTAVG